MGIRGSTIDICGTYIVHCTCYAQLHCVGIAINKVLRMPTLPNSIQVYTVLVYIHTYMYNVHTVQYTLIYYIGTCTYMYMYKHVHVYMYSHRKT